MSQERTYVLGGETRKRTLFAGVTGRQVAVLAVGVVLWMMALLVLRSLWVLLAGVIVALMTLLVARRRNALGESWAAGVINRMTGSSREAPDFVPGEALPVEVGEVRVLAYEPPSALGAPMAIIHHKDSRRASWASGHLTATFEIQGGGDGLLPVRQVNTAGLLFERLLGGLASAEIPVDQLDICTRVLPVPSEAYTDHMTKLVVPSAPDRLRASMRELAGFAAGNAEQYRSFATIRIPLQLLNASVMGPMDLEEVCEQVFQTVGEVTRRVDGAGYRLRAVLGPMRLGALIRHLHDPDHDMDDMTGIGTVADGWSQIRHRGRDWTMIEGAARDWYHAIGHVPRDAWPAQPLNSRWMEHLVTQISPATIRTVQSQFRLIPKVRAREIARIGLTYDTATKSSQQKKKQVSTGETEASMSAARRTLMDLMQPVVGGVYPTVRVMVSAPSPDLLTAGRKRVTGAAENGGVTRLKWTPYQHHKALLTCMPMARGVKA